MNVDDVKRELNAIRNIAYDDEQAHYRLDALYKNVLQEIASNGGWAGELAEEALRGEDIQFSRWYA